MGKKCLKGFTLVATILIGLLAMPSVTLSKDALYEVVYPLGISTETVKPLAPRLTDLNGKTICELWNYLFRGEITFPKIEELLRKQYPGVKFISCTELPNIHGPDEQQMIKTLGDLLLKKGCDAVISGNGG